MSYELKLYLWISFFYLLIVFKVVASHASQAIVEAPIAFQCRDIAPSGSILFGDGGIEVEDGALT